MGFHKIENLICTACKSGDLNTVKMLFTQYDVYHLEILQNQRAIESACEGPRANIEVVRYLLDNYRYVSPLVFENAIENAHIDILHELTVVRDIDPKELIKNDWEDLDVDWPEWYWNVIESAMSPAGTINIKGLS